MAKGIGYSAAFSGLTALPKRQARGSGEEAAGSNGSTRFADPAHLPVFWTRSSAATSTTALACRRPMLRLPHHLPHMIFCTDPHCWTLEALISVTPGLSVPPQTHPPRFLSSRLLYSDFFPPRVSEVSLAGRFPLVRCQLFLLRGVRLGIGCLCPLSVNRL
jgi:hypothetical protein